MIRVNGFVFTASAQRAAWLLAGRDSLVPLDGAISEGEVERLELVDTIATRIKRQARAQTPDMFELAVCRRLLEHLRGPLPDERPGLRLQ